MQGAKQGGKPRWGIVEERSGECCDHGIENEAAAVAGWVKGEGSA